MEKKIEKFMRTYTGKIRDVAFDDAKDGEAALITFKDEKGVEHTFPPYSIFKFVERYHNRVSDGIIGTEATCFPFTKDVENSAYDRFKTLCVHLGLEIKFVPSIFVSRRGAEQGLTPDERVDYDTILLSRGRETTSRWYSIPEPPSADFCKFDRKIGLEISRGRKKNSAAGDGTYPTEWASFLPADPRKHEIYPLSENRSSVIFDGKSYRNTVMPFAYLAARCVEEGLSRNEYWAVARMFAARYRNKHQVSLKDNKRGSGAIFASLFYHELVKGQFNRNLGLKSSCGNGKQVATFGGDHGKTAASRKLVMNDAKNAILWIYHRASEPKN